PRRTARCSKGFSNSRREERQRICRTSPTASLPDNLAAFCSGGSLAPPGEPALAPEEGLTARGVTRAVLFAAAWREWHQRTNPFCHFLEQGLLIASGANRRKSEN